MFKHISTLFFILILNSLQAQSIKTITEKYQGFLFSTISEIDSFDVNGRLVKSTTCLNKRCKEQSIYKYIYNNKGQLTDSYIIDRINNQDSIVHHHSYRCFNENTLAWNKEITEECIQQYDYPAVWHWNKNGQLVRIISIDSFDVNNIDFPFYNPHGTMDNLIVERSHIKGSLDYLCKVDYEYQAALLTKMTYKYYDEGKRSATSIYLYEYDSLKRIIKRTIIDKDFIISNYTKIYHYKWNEDRLQTMTLEWFENDKITEKVMTFYEYDTNHNLVKTIEKQLLPKEKTMAKIRYQYEYYDE